MAPSLLLLLPVAVAVAPWESHCTSHQARAAGGGGQAGTSPTWMPAGRAEGSCAEGRPPLVPLPAGAALLALAGAALEVLMGAGPRQSCWKRGLDRTSLQTQAARDG